jgi:hypothetical protein
MAAILGGLVSEAYKLAFSISPIILTGGIASSIPGSSLPIVAVLDSLTSGVQGITALASGQSLSAALTPFATFEPASGGSLISAQLASYPFASRAVAANAQITTPLQVSLRMIAPAQGVGGYALKTATMVALKLALDRHMAQGGLFTILTPSYIYKDCVLMDLRDATGGQTKQKQVEWTWQFQQPLTQETQLTQVLSNLMGKISSGLPTGGNAWSSITTVVGNGVQSVENGITSVENGLSSAGKFLGL